MSLTTVPINVDNLKTLVAKEEWALRLCEYLAQRNNDARVSKVEQLMNVVENVGRYDVIRTLKRLEGLGAGTFLAGRKGHPSRFEWIVSSRELGQAAISPEDDPTFHQVSPDTMADVEDEEADVPVEHTFKLRKDYSAMLSLPADLSKREAARLAAFIMTLPLAD